MATIREKDINKYWQGCGWWECKMAQPLWKPLWCFLKKTKNRITVWFSHPTSGYLPKRFESRVSKRYLYAHVHSSIFHNSQKVEAARVCINRWMHKQNGMLLTYNGIYILRIECYSALKKKETDAWYHINEPWRHFGKWNSLVTKRQILSDST